MTTPFIAEAERAAAEALHDRECGGRDDVWSGYDCTRMADGSWNKSGERHVEAHAQCAAVVIAAVVPILVEHFARAVEAVPTDLFGGRVTLTAAQVRKDAARVIREAATPTDGGAA